MVKPETPVTQVHWVLVRHSVPSWSVGSLRAVCGGCWANSPAVESPFPGRTLYTDTANPDRIL